MKYTLLLLLIGCNTTCFVFRDKDIPKQIKQIKVEHIELIDMGGVSTFREFDRPIRFTKIDTKEPRVRVSKKKYSSFSLKLHLDANNDTGKDRLTIFHGTKLIYITDFDVLDVKLKFAESSEDILYFIVDNPSMPNNTAGAFQASIKIVE